jgi:Cu(I)/Ag(I) efflux system membrane protein CusA/SilA
MFGFSSIYIIFKEDAEFYWSRSRILEKLNSLPSGTLPQGVSPQLGHDATALGQVFWYTLEGMTEDGKPSGGWDLDELRSTQDWYVRYALQGVEGVAEVASIGGFVKEYQIDVDPDALRTYGIPLSDVFNAVRGSNLDVGARTIEINAVEYVIRGIGFVKNLDDLRQTVITQRDKIRCNSLICDEPDPDRAHLTGQTGKYNALENGKALNRFGQETMCTGCHRDRLTVHIA